jgi:glycosyltransferase involved in cell wall biosynthesis
MSLQRILIVTTGPLCRNPRPLKEAETLGRAGYDVTVLMVRNHEPSEPFDAELMRSAPFRREAIDMIPGHSAGAARLLWRRGLSSLARKTAPAFGLGKVRALGPGPELLRRARLLPADLTIVHNEAAHWAGIRLLAEGRRVAADIEDWHSEDLLPETRARRPLGLIRSIEGSLLSRAAYVTTTSHALAEALRARYGGREPDVITNSFPLQPDPRKPAPDAAPAFFWFSQTIGPGRGLELFLAGWMRVSHPSRIVLLGRPQEGYIASLMEGLPPDRRSQVSVLPLVAPGELPAVIAGHDIGLALEQSFIANRDLTITNKMLQYLNAGLVVVASDTRGQREVLGHAPDAGIIVKLAEAGEVTRALDLLLADRSALAHRQAAARRLAEQVYCWEKEAPRLLDIVKGALDR